MPAAVGADRELRAKHQSQAGRLIERLGDQSSEIFGGRSDAAHPNFRRDIGKPDLVKYSFGANPVEDRYIACRGQADRIRIVSGVRRRVAAYYLCSGPPKEAQVEPCQP